ncbi:hypothetical protein [Spiroplasma endosymbiont of Asaphidion curtum]|uniref:hypothetical protein n=1 Tax=Spiroplasma endosymbiont of Asaphidion curtum TaxID=3066281 RepID=UPI00313E8CB8
MLHLENNIIKIVDKIEGYVPSLLLIKKIGEIFEDIKNNKIIEDNIFSKFLKIQNKSIEIKDIAVLIKTIITYVPILITFIINFAEKLENDFNEEIINDLKPKPYQGLLDNKNQPFTLQNIKNTFKNIFRVLNYTCKCK